jgi:rhamnogalacturonan endolyase
MGHGEYEDKCDFTANQFENAAFGWSSTTRKVGFWFLSPSVEYEDVHMNAASVTRMRVGLSHPAYTIHPVSRTGAAMPDRQIDWQTDAKHYEFWAFADNGRRFQLAAVRSGNYTLHAFADGVLGEFAKANVTVTEGKPLDLGAMEWTPVRRGTQIWEIGIPNRTESEFAKGDDYAHDGMFLTYAKLFPSDVN